MQRQHLTEYESRDPTKIQKNPGLRTLAKMMLNSMWGKFGQHTNKTQVQEFDDPQKFTAFLESDKFDIRYVGVLTKNAWRCITDTRWKMIQCQPTSISSWRVLRPVDAFTRPLISYKIVSSTLTLTVLC